MDTPVLKSKITGDKRAFYSVISILCCIAGAAVCGVLSWQPAFVQNSPTEYGMLMFTILTAGIVGTFVGYVTTIIEIFCLPGRSSNVQLIGSVVLLLAAAVFVGVSMVTTFQKHSFNSRFEWDDLLTIGFALASATAVFVVSRNSEEPRWKLQFWIIELPLFVSLVFVIAGKWIVFDQASPQFNQYITGLDYYPKGTPFGYEQIACRIRGDFRAAFWTGTMAGVIGVQLIVAQLAALGLGIGLKKRGENEVEDKKMLQTDEKPKK